MAFNNGFELPKRVLENLNEVQIEKQKLNYLKKELLDYETGRKYLNLSIDEMRNKIYDDSVPYYLTDEEAVYFRKSELDYWIFSGKISTTEDFDKVINNIVSQLCRC